FIALSQAVWFGAVEVELTTATFASGPVCLTISSTSASAISWTPAWFTKNSRREVSGFASASQVTVWIPWSRAWDRAEAIWSGSLQATAIALSWLVTQVLIIRLWSSLRSSV